jgi:putative transposase
VLKDEIAEFLKEVLVETVILYKFKVESLEVVEDHVHALVSATPQHTIPNIVNHQ